VYRICSIVVLISFIQICHNYIYNDKGNNQKADPPFFHQIPLPLLLIFLLFVNIIPLYSNILFSLLVSKCIYRDLKSNSLSTEDLSILFKNLVKASTKIYCILFIFMPQIDR